MRHAVRLLPASILAFLVLAASALAVPCGPDRCRTFADASGADGAIAPGPDGNMWFVGQGFVGRLTPGGAVSRFSVPATSSSDIEPGPDGGLWFTAPGLVARMGTDGQVTVEKPVKGNPGPIAPAADGTMWFTGGIGSVSRVGPDGGLLRVASADTASASRTPPAGAAGSMVKGPDNALWFVESNPAGIGRIGPDGKITDYPLPGSFGRDLAAITPGPDGGLWFTAPGARMVGRISPTSGHVIGFRTSWTPYAITAGPSHSVWFAMTDSGRWAITRLVPAGYMSFFQVSGPVRGLAAGPDEAIYITRGSSIERLEPFLGAYPVRRRNLAVNRFAGSTSMRLFCPKFDLVFCAGTITLRTRTGQMVARAPFSQRVNDAPATRILLNAAGRRLTRHNHHLPVLVTIRQHDQGGVWREHVYAFTLVPWKR